VFPRHRSCDRNAFSDGRSSGSWSCHSNAGVSVSHINAEESATVAGAKDVTVREKQIAELTKSIDVMKSKLPQV
jgi:hypothetical protein